MAWVDKVGTYVNKPRTFFVPNVRDSRETGVPTGKEVTISGGKIVSETPTTKPPVTNNTTTPPRYSGGGSRSGGSRSGGSSGTVTQGTSTQTGVVMETVPTTPRYEVKTFNGNNTNNTNNTIPQTISDKVKDTGTIVTYEMAVQSLRNKGNKGYLQQNQIELERHILQSRAYTPQQRETGNIVAQTGFLGIGAFLAPLAIAGFGGSVAGSILGGLAITNAAVPASKGTYNTIDKSELTYEESKALSKKADDRVATRVNQEGLDLPFFNDEQEKITGGLIGTVVNELPGGRIISGKKAEEEYYKILIEQGYNETDAKRIAKTETNREFVSGGVGELIGFAGAGQITGEVVGRGVQFGISKAYGTGTKVFTPAAATMYGAVSGFIGSSAGGAVETAVIYPAMQKGRNREMTMENYMTAISFGTLSAGLIGGTVGALTTRPTAQKVVYGLASAAEAGQEYVGDAGANLAVGNSLDVFMNIQKNVAKVKAPVSSYVPTDAVISSLVGGSKSGANSSSSAQGGSQSSTKNFVNGTDFVSVPVSSNIPTSIFTETYNPKPPTVTDTRGRSKPGNDTPTQTSGNTETPVPTDTPVEEPTKTPVNTVTATMTPTIIPTFTPTITARGYPFFPPIAGGGDWGAKSGKRERTRFIDEFTMAFSSLAVPAQPVYFGKRSSASMTRDLFKPTKFKRKKVKVRGAPRFIPGGAPNVVGLFV